jgi:hypothetical protein
MCTPVDIHANPRSLVSADSLISHIDDIIPFFQDCWILLLSDPELSRQNVDLYDCLGCITQTGRVGVASDYQTSDAFSVIPR